MTKAKKRAQRTSATTPMDRKPPADAFSLPDGHHMGKDTGFTKKDGRLYVAPTHSQPMDAIRVDRDALQDFIDATNRHIHGEMQKLRRREDAWWKRVQDDLGVEIAAIRYLHGYGCLEKQTKKSANPAPAPQEPT